MRSIVLGTMIAVAAPAFAISHGDAQAVRATLQRYVSAWLANDPDAVMRELSPDAVLIPGEKTPYVGAAAIRNYWWPPGAAAFAIVRFDSTVDSVTGSDDIAICRGTQIIEWTSGAERWRTSGNYVTVLRKTAAGWRITLQMAANGKNERVGG